MKLRFIDLIWTLRGTVPMDPTLPTAAALARLEAMMQEPGTSYNLGADYLRFSKKAPRSQDKLASYAGGVLQVERSDAGAVLHYELDNRTLLFCFCLPFFFLFLAWLLKESRTPAYVFSGMFAVLYAVGRWLEPWLARRNFSELVGAPATDGASLASGAPIPGALLPTREQI